MPRIAEYTNDINAPRPNDASKIVAQTGEQIGEMEKQTGQAIGSGLNSLGQAVKTQAEQAETTGLAANLAALHGKLSLGLATAFQNADPNDPNVAQDFLNNTAGPAIDQLGQGLTTTKAQQMYATAAAGLKADLMERAHAGQANLSEFAVTQNITNMSDNYAATVENDPSAWKNTLGLADLSLMGLKSSHPDLSNEQMMKLRDAMHQQITEGAARGAVRQNPEQALTDLNSGVYNDLGAEKTNTLKNAANEMLRVGREDATREAAAAREQRAQTSLDTAGDYFTKIAQAQTDPNAEKGLGTAALQDPKLLPAERETIANYSAKLAKGEPAANDPATLGMIMTQAGAPDADPKEVLQAAQQALTKGTLEISGYTFIKELMKQPTAKEDTRLLTQSFDNVKAKFGLGGFGVGPPDPDAMQSYTGWQAKMLRDYTAGLSRGLTSDQMLSPDSKDVLPEIKNPMAYSTRNATGIPLRNLSGATVAPVAPANRPSLDSIFGGK